ncbi:hypothetical protein PHJA_000597700 [Phtheirospermum japonicum]|uniref:Retrotransposon Copia-like N-terminal domain-containing protein n=1 Tax=Phtheirospermum japonicum TaxID=374723 RepID=A0A830BHE6_9LAMI|nr:hypothetical protein PHJA_000597700 [Phtheirospermum japonicum]
MTTDGQNTNASATQILFTASGGASANLQFPALTVRLDRSNYFLWRGTVRSALEAYELESFLVPGNAPPTTLPPTTNSIVREPNPAFPVWNSKDKLILLWV